MMENNEPLNAQLEFFLLNCFNIVKEVCRNPPKEVFTNTLGNSNSEKSLTFSSFLNMYNNTSNSSPQGQEKEININKLDSPSKELKKELLYILLDYYIIQNEQIIFQNVYDLMIKYSESSRISYKFYVILKKYCIKYFSSLHLIKGNRKDTEKSDQNLISKIIDTSNEQFLIIPNKKNNYNTYKDDPFKRFIDVTINSLKTIIKEEESKSGNSFFSKFFFTKNKTLLSKELDGTNILDFFTILNTSEEYASSHINNIAVFSVCYELIKFIFNSIKTSTTNLTEDNIEKMFWSFREMKLVLHSYCIRIFDQCENYLESNKNKTMIDKNTEYNLNLIEAAVWESLKIINLICKLETSLVSNINMRMKQVYERIALKQSGLVFLEILQFFIDNCNLIIIDLDYYVSEFFKLKLKFNYKYEILSFTTLEFLYKNKEILNQKTQVFSSFFPLIIKIFATFPKYLDTKFFTLVEYMTKPTTITELFNYFLDLPVIILLIENFECYSIATGSNFITDGNYNYTYSYSNSNFNYNSSSKMIIEDIFQPEYVKLVEFLLRDIAFEQEYQFSSIYTNQFNKQVKYIFESLIFTSRVHSTTKIVPKLMKKFFDVIIQRDECESASETIILIFERFSYFHENEHYKQEIRNLLIRKLEEMFKKWPKIVTSLREKILWQIKNNYSNPTKRELICLLCWSLGEFLFKQGDNSFEDEGISETFDCLEKLLRDKIKYFGNSKDNEVHSTKIDESVEDVLKCKGLFYLHLKF